MSAKEKLGMPGQELIGKDLAAVERLLTEEVRSEVKLVLEVSRHILGSGGKRFRPALALLSGRLCGLRRKRELHYYAAGIELAHNATLLHDDVIDEAEVRRGQRAANRLWGADAAVIVGDYLLFKSFSFMLVGGDLRVIEYMDAFALEMAEGEAYQLAQKSRVDLSEQEYERIVRAKTAIMIQAACRIPAIAAGLPNKRQEALADFGYQLGMAFQIVDDVLDYAAVDAGWGKAVGKDFMESKTTLPLIIAFQRASEPDRRRIRELFKKPAKTRRDLGELLAIMAKADALAAAMDRARDRIAAAKASLSIFPKSPTRAAMLELADFVVSRAT